MLLSGLLWASLSTPAPQVARQFNMSAGKRVSERTRIARDLHDTLLQKFSRTVAAVSNGF